MGPAQAFVRVQRRKRQQHRRGDGRGDLVAGTAEQDRHERAEGDQQCQPPQVERQEDQVHLAEDEAHQRGRDPRDPACTLAE